MSHQARCATENIFVTRILWRTQQIWGCATELQFGTPLIALSVVVSWQKTNLCIFCPHKPNVAVSMCYGCSFSSNRAIFVASIACTTAVHDVNFLGFIHINLKSSACVMWMYSLDRAIVVTSTSYMIFLHRI